MILGDITVFKDDLADIDKKELIKQIDGMRIEGKQMQNDGTVNELWVIAELSLITYKSQEKLNKLTKILTILTAVLIVFTAILVIKPA